MPPRHGKSWLTSWWFPVWFLLFWPHKRIILASYQAQFAASWGRRVRNTIAEIGGDFGVYLAPDSTAADRWDTTADGGMITAGVGGAITGRGGDLLIVDDPVKSGPEAASETMRAKTWDWFTSTAYTRLEPGGSALVMQTRWHQADLYGKLEAGEEGEAQTAWDQIVLPAIAETNDPIGRPLGAALWPARYDEAALDRKRKGVLEYNWLAQYQQRPVQKGGGMFKRVDFEPVPARPTAGVLFRIRTWDLAASTSEAAKRTAGVLFCITNDGLGYIEDSICGQWEPAERDQLVRHTAEVDGRQVLVLIEQEPGSGGIAQIETLKRILYGYAVEGSPATGSKEVRAGPVATAVGTHRIRIVQGPWNPVFLAETDGFPLGDYSDQVDALAHGYNKIAELLEAQHITFQPETTAYTVERVEDREPEPEWRPNRIPPPIR